MVEVDVETGAVEVKKLWFVHDCGRVINPMIVEGQIHGGLVMGLGSVLYEEIAHNDEGMPLATTFADYLIPSSAEVGFDLEIAHLETPSPLNPLGAKGVGEAGVIPIAAVIASAVDDALSEFGAFIRKSPIKQEDVLREVSRASGQ
jgi:carbon-monoxide dehydrogenase large subunit